MVRAVTLSDRQLIALPPSSSRRTTGRPFARRHAFVLARRPACLGCFGATKELFRPWWRPRRAALGNTDEPNQSRDDPPSPPRIFGIRPVALETSESIEIPQTSAFDFWRFFASPSAAHSGPRPELGFFDTIRECACKPEMSSPSRFQTRCCARTWSNWSSFRGIDPMRIAA